MSLCSDPKTDVLFAALSYILKLRHEYTKYGKMRNIKRNPKLSLHSPKTGGIRSAAGCYHVSNMQCRIIGFVRICVILLQFDYLHGYRLAQTQTAKCAIIPIKQTSVFSQPIPFWNAHFRMICKCQLIYINGSFKCANFNGNGCGWETVVCWHYVNGGQHDEVSVDTVHMDNSL